MQMPVRTRARSLLRSDGRPGAERRPRTLFADETSGRSARKEVERAILLNFPHDIDHPVSVPRQRRKIAPWGLGAKLQRSAR